MDYISIFFIILTIAFVIIFSVLIIQQEKIEASINEWYIQEKTLKHNGDYVFQIVGYYERKGKSEHIVKQYVVPERVFDAYEVGQMFDKNNIKTS